ncbi:MAG: helix-turn-helix transcriptional regulator [Streptomyces sp.]|nr:helix-turn-helix transcriptional regulator [Streptomyces sp.]
MPRPRSEIKQGVSDDMRAFAEFLRELVDGCGITQKDLARKIGFPEQRLSETLRGELLPLLRVIESLVKATVPASRQHMMLSRAKRLHKAAATAPHAPALVRSERQVESLLAQKERLFNDLDALRKDGALLEVVPYGA